MGFAVATGHKKCTEAATEVLAAGGNAIDAAISAAFMSFIAEPVLASPLAGGFLMVAGKDRPARVLDAFVQTPRHKRSTADTDCQEVLVDFGTTQQAFHCGAGTIATPGIIPGLFAAHERLGRVPMQELAAEAVRVARAGLEITPFKAQVFGLVANIFKYSPAAREIYCPDGELLKAGELLKNPALADTLEVLAIEGPRLFTEGEVAQALLSLDGGHLQAEDLRRYDPIWRNPLEIERRGAKISLNPAPSLGGVQIALALLALPDMPKDDLIARALYEVACLRRDTDLDHNAAEAKQLMLDPPLVAKLRKTLIAHQAATRGTTHISVLDNSGLGVSLTLSNGEGCGLIAPGTGIMANNMLGEDDLVPDGLNSWTPNVRLASMMCPSVIRQDGKLTLLGSGGSNRIRSAIATVALNLIDREMPLEAAIEAPRMHVETGTESILDFEMTTEERYKTLTNEFPDANAWGEPSMYFGGVHAVQMSGNHMQAAADFRRGGSATAV